jgi:hypothetical protein
MSKKQSARSGTTSSKWWTLRSVGARHFGIPATRHGGTFCVLK